VPDRTMDTEALDSLTAHLDAALFVVTAATSKERDGCLIGFHSQSGLDPPRYAVWLSKANATYRIALFATHLGVHVLDRSDHDVAALFGGTTADDVDKFAACEWAVGPHGVPLLSRCPNWVVLRRTATVLVRSKYHAKSCVAPGPNWFSENRVAVRFHGSRTSGRPRRRFHRVLSDIQVILLCRGWFADWGG